MTLSKMSSKGDKLAFLILIAVLIGLSTLTLAPVHLAFGQSTSSCESAQLNLNEARSWAARYQPLASRGGVYRKAYEQSLMDITSAQVDLQRACHN